MTKDMIDLYTWKTPNGYKASIMLEEVQLPYKIHLIDIGANDQFKPEFLKINPNNKIPAIVDPVGPDGKPITVFESGAILIYLAEKTGKLLSHDPRRRAVTLQWLMFQMGGVGPMFGQLGHFLKAAPRKISYAIDRYSNEVNRIYKVMNQRLSEVDFFAGEYSIADIAILPWVHIHPWHQIDLNQYPSVKRWYTTLMNRPAVQEGLQSPPRS